MAQSGMTGADNEGPDGEGPLSEGTGRDRDEFLAGEDRAPLGAGHDEDDTDIADADADAEVDSGAARLPLDSDDDVRLPWLESGADDADDDAGSGALLKLVLLGLLALGVIVGGIWFASRSASGPDLVAAGGVIPAPAEPYKEKPKDPGGRTFAGTGDTSFAVSEGQNRPAGMAADGEAARPGFDAIEAGSGKSDAKAGLPAHSPGAAATATKAAAATPAASQAPAGAGVGVQVGAFSSRAAAEAAWSKLAQQHQSLSGLSHRVVEGRADIGTVYRLQAVSADAGAARALCSQLRGAGLACQVKN